MFADYEKILEVLDEHIDRYPYSYFKRQALQAVKDELLKLYEAEREEFESHFHDGHDTCPFGGLPY